ncbi:MAG: metallophosphoesterase family protein [Zavarzinella sp.]
MYDVLILSDLHLGSDNCQAKELIRLLEQVRNGEILTSSIILNGDVFDSIDFRRLKKNHWKVLSLIRKMSDWIDITWISGNHDGSAEMCSHLLGVDVCDQKIIQSGDQRILFHHGHRFDEFIDRHPFLTAFADAVYRFLQKIDSSHHIARTAKKRSKIFLRCTEKIQNKSIELAEKLNCQAVCCGHTHHPVCVETGPVRYYNSGCWTEKPCHYLTVKDGHVRLHSFAHEEVGELVGV